MENALQIEYEGNMRIEIHQDPDPCNPREDSNLGKMACFHKRYRMPKEAVGLDSADYANWDEMEQAIRFNFDAVVVLPIYMYDHGGITVSTRAFSCPWDSGQIGFIFATKKAIEGEYGKVTKAVIAKVTRILEGEVEAYDRFLKGESYGYVISKKCPTCEEYKFEDSCYGFDSVEYAIEEGRKACQT